jgi:hypothetical protein
MTRQNLNFQPLLSPKRLAGLVLLTLFAGCGGGLVQVSGTVTVDGQPTEGVSLVFLPMGEDTTLLPATTTSGPGGSFSLSTNLEIGVSPGNYRVTATWPDPNHKAVALGFSDPEPAPDVFKGRYSGQSSVLTQEIRGPLPDLKIDLVSKP